MLGCRPSRTCKVPQRVIERINTVGFLVVGFNASNSAATNGEKNTFRRAVQAALARSDFSKAENGVRLIFPRSQVL